MSIDFTPTNAQRDLQLEARRFAQTTLSQVFDLTRNLPTPQERFLATRPIYEQVVRAGFLRRIIPAPFGGEGTGNLDIAILAEEFHAVDVNVSLTLLATLLGLAPLLIAGTAEQHQQFLPAFLNRKGTPLAALASSEPGGSANFAAPPPAEGVRTRAEMDGSDWVISGTKQWVSGDTGWQGEGPDLMCVVCRTDPTAGGDTGLSVIAVPRPETGLVAEHFINSLGHRAHLTPRFRLESVRVPQGNLLGRLGGGKAIVDASFTGTAAIVGVLAVGIMRAAFAYALRFAKTERRAGAVPIIEHQAVGYALADAKALIEATRYLSWRACHALDAGAPGAFELALQAKVFGSETAVNVITSLMRIVGVDSYDNDQPLGSLLQDALALPVFDGGNMGVRRRQLHEIMMQPGYDPLSAVGSA